MSARTELPGGRVTFLFTDIEGSTRLARMLGAGYPPVLRAHRALLRRVLSERGGVELFTEGDSFFFAFADAAAALASCLDAQRALAAHSWPAPEAAPRVRMGLHTGYADPVGGEYTSPEVHRAARIAAAAHGGQVLCSVATARHAARLPDGAGLVDLGPHRLRGFDDQEHLLQLVAPGLQRTFPRQRTPQAAPDDNLPTPHTSFVGRRAEFTDLTALVGAHRLVTVVGAGGSGKTRLAVEVARDLAGGYADGVWFVDVAEVTDPRWLPMAVATALGLRPEPGRPVLNTLLEHAVSRRMLLVLDTCDAQPRAVADLVVPLLTRGRDVRVLATSRQPLGECGELVWRIPGLSVAAEPTVEPGDAVQLLLERAATARGGQGCSPRDIPYLRQVAARLDGLPLAIEQVAARLRVLSASQLAERIDDVIRADAGAAEPPSGGDDDRTEMIAELHASARHASLHASIGWSYRRLGLPAARLLRRLAVFAGPVDLATAEWCAEADVFEPLARLVDTSMLHVEQTPAGPRYRMPGAVRAYALRRLAEAGDEAAARERHVGWAMRALHTVGHDADGSPRTLSLHALDEVADELRTALSWCATVGDPRPGLLLAAGLDPWWHEHRRSAEARTRLVELYARCGDGDGPVPAVDLAAAYLVHAGHTDDPSEQVRFLQRAEAAARHADDPELLVRVLAAASGPLLRSGRLADAERLCRDVLERAARCGVRHATLPVITSLAQLLWRRGALDEAAALLGSARPVEAARPQDRGRRTVDMLLGMVALRRGDLVAAHDHLVVALRSRMRYGFRAAAGETVNAVAVRCAIGGDPRTAAMLFGAADASRDAPATGLFAGFWATQQAVVRAALGDVVFDDAYAEGARLDLDQTVAVALAVEHPDLAADSTRFEADARTVS